MTPAFVLTYHAVERGEGPLFVDEETFARHLDCIVASGAEAVTVSELVARLRSGALRRPTVAVTFDDGIASVAHIAAPLLVERGLPATIFCVAGHLGGTNDWPSALPGATPLELAGAEGLAMLARQGFEIGCHGMTHAPLPSCRAADLWHELVSARDALEQVVQAPVRAYAYPYGAVPAREGRRAVAAAFESAWTTVIREIVYGADLHELPRVDAHYFRDVPKLARALERGLEPSLRIRGLASRTRRGVRKDYRRRVWGRSA